MSLRFTLLWSRLMKIKVTIPVSKIPKLTPKILLHGNVTVPCTLGFSIFTWLGFEKKLSAEDELIHTIKHCVLFTHRGEYQKAEQLLHVALRQAQQIHHQLGITYIYDVMANLALEREQLDKAKTLFINVSQRLMADGAKEDDSRVVHISVKLARISHLQKDYTTAQLGYDWCMEKLQKAMKIEPTDGTKTLLAMTEDWYGRLFLECNRSEEGLKCMITSLNRMKEVDNVEKEHIVIQLNDIGTVLHQTGKCDDSIVYFKEAIELGKTINMEDISPMYVNLGRAYIKKNLIDEARKSCGYAWRVSIDKSNEDSKKEAESCLKEIQNLS